MLIECASQSARFVVHETTSVSIKGLQFVGCGSNTVTTVKKLIVKDSIFQGVEGEGRGTALVLDEVTFAKIIKSSFISNTPGNNSQQHYVGEFVRDQIILYVVGLQPDDLVSVGGALLSTYSNVSLTDTNFILNTAELGGVFLAYQSNITVIRCTCNYNRAHFGGVMFTVELSITTDNSTFSSNAAEEDVGGVDSSAGGVMATYNGSVTIQSCTFTHNTAGQDGGVLLTFDGSFKIMSSTFTNNTADYGGGVMHTSGGSFNITSIVLSHTTLPSGTES